jgi:hypothetical protein
MTQRIHRIFAAAGLAASLSLSFPHAYGAEDREGPKPEQAEERATDKAAPKERRKPQAATDTVSCRRDAQGLHGPERATFMTECLKTRR